MPIRAMRQACRRYHDEANLDFRLIDFHARDHDATAGFFMALGAFRATVGYQVALLAGHYNLDVEGDLADVLPTLDEDGL